VAWPVSGTPAETYAALLQRAKDDPAVLAFWLGGSRGMGRATQHSDYDCVFIVAEDAYPAFCAEFGLAEPFQMDWRPEVDLAIRTFPMLEAAAAWGSDEQVYRYGFAHLKANVDKTGLAQPLIDEKARVPAEEVQAFIHASLDHALNQAYRALKCLRDGLPAASRLEAAEAVAPFLDAAFALHDRRLRPYYKYLAWELESFPLDKLPIGPSALLDRLADLLSPGAGPVLCKLLADCREVFRAAGHGAAFDGWGGKLGWILAGDPAGPA